MTQNIGTRLCFFCYILRRQRAAHRGNRCRRRKAAFGAAYCAQAFREDSGITFPLLIDDKRQAYRAAGLESGSPFHLFRQDNSLARQRARAAGHRQHKLGKNPFQLGGSFVFGSGIVDLYTHVSQTFGDSARPADLLAVIL